MPYGADAQKRRISAGFARTGAGGGGLRTPASRDGHIGRSAKISKAESTFACTGGDRQGGAVENYTGLDPLRQGRVIGCDE